MRILALVLISLLMSCKNNKMDEKEATQKIVPVTTSSDKAKEHFDKARFLVQNGINSNPTEHYKKAIELDEKFVRMYNFISMYSRNDSIKKQNHKLAKKYKHLASEEERMLVDATEFRLNNPNDMYEAKLFELAARCASD